MKKDIRYSYKRGSDRNIRAKAPTSIYQQAIFSCSLFNEIQDGYPVVNVDESIFNRSIKSNYSWLPVNKSSEIVNVDAQGRTTMIWALLSNGSWIWFLIDDTTTSQDFWLFLFILKTYIETNFLSRRERTTLILDNASIHLTRESKLTASRYDMKMLGIPPYWPHLAPVEFVFGLVKGFIKNSCQWKLIDYSKRSGKIAIMRGLECLTREKALRMWRKVIRIGRETILEVYEETKEASKDQPQNNVVGEEHKHI